MPLFDPALIPEKMILFWAVIATLTLGALVFILPPLLRPARRQGVPSDQLDEALLKEQQEEILSALGEARITWEQAEQARAEIDARLAAEVGESGDEKAGRWRDRGGGAVISILAVLIIVTVSAGLYISFGAWRGLEMRYSTGEMLVGQLAREMQRTPDDAQGWLLLGGAYRRLGQADQAAAAYSEFNRLNPAAETLVAEAEMRALANEGVWQGRPASLIEEALRLNPSHGPALWYAGLIASQKQDHAAALRYWESLARADLPDEFRAVVQRQIDEMLAKQGDSALQIAVRVSVEPSLTDRIPEQAVLFVVAKSPEGGPPLAVLRRPAGELPGRFILHDGQAMLPGHNLSSFSRWLVQARLSASGDALPQPGDLQGEQTVEMPLSGQTLELVIDELLTDDSVSP